MFDAFGKVVLLLNTSLGNRLISVPSLRCGKFLLGAKTEKSDAFHKVQINLPVGLLFFFFVDILSFSVLAAGSERVGAKYFLPELLPILSDLGRAFCFLLATASVS